LGTAGRADSIAPLALSVPAPLAGFARPADGGGAFTSTKTNAAGPSTASTAIVYTAHAGTALFLRGVAALLFVTCGVLSAAPWVDADR
jgi:hypothetical protein